MTDLKHVSTQHMVVFEDKDDFILTKAFQTSYQHSLDVIGAELNANNTIVPSEFRKEEWGELVIDVTHRPDLTARGIPSQNRYGFWQKQHMYPQQHRIARYDVKVVWDFANSTSWCFDSPFLQPRSIPYEHQLPYREDYEAAYAFNKEHPFNLSYRLEALYWLKSTGSGCVMDFGGLFHIYDFCGKCHVDTFERRTED